MEIKELNEKLETVKIKYENKLNYNRKMQKC